MKKPLGLLFLLLSTACAQLPGIPDWVMNQPLKYPASRYLCGRGQGETVGLASDRARADLAKVFEVKVRESSSDLLQWQQGTGSRDGLQSRTSRDISVQTDQVINGVQIAELWRSPDGGDFHALAVLDRLQASQLLQTEIDGLDIETDKNIARARVESTLPEKISAAYNAFDAQLKRRHPQQMLQIVDKTGNGLPEKYPISQLRSDLERLLERWQIGLVVVQDELGGLEEILAGALGNAGIHYLADRAAAAYLLKAELDSENLATPDGWYWRRGSLRIYLLETASSNVIGSYQWRYKVSSRQADMVDIRTRAQLADLLRADLPGVLVEFGDVEQQKK